MADIPPADTPPFVWHRLTENGRLGFIELRKSFRKDAPRPPTGIFKAELEMIKAYIEEDPREAIDRATICGIFFSPKFICVNNRALKLLLGRCKSSINIGFQNLGYHSAKTKVRKIILTEIPILKYCPTIARQWTVRYLVREAPRKELPTPILPVVTGVQPNVPRLSLGHVDFAADEFLDNEGIDFDQLQPPRVDDEFTCEVGSLPWETDLYSENPGKGVYMEREREDEWPSFVM